MTLRPASSNIIFLSLLLPPITYCDLTVVSKIPEALIPRRNAYARRRGEWDPGKESKPECWMFKVTRLHTVFLCASKNGTQARSMESVLSVL